ncbi:hypothetical protein [Amycolatopsis jejuensis]|uniref:hypothetical protein n=1 Tax=Amycolatopsis jejuensis TaxID=330084 RepID=UPI000527AB67|nr:hypothetical protein [Amycolatopsis jejuensis]
MNLKRKIGGAATAAALACTGLFLSPGVGEAATVYKFRLSQFAFVVANVCVRTDVEQVCSGFWGKGKSEVFDVKANRTSGWRCDADVKAAVDASKGPFDRNEFKECALHGDPFGTSFELKRP